MGQFSKHLHNLHSLLGKCFSNTSNSGLYRPFEGENFYSVLYFCYNSSMSVYHLMSALTFLCVQKCMMRAGARERTGECGESLEAVCSAGE